jgi:catechol 2,3-dioxygenase-like lactoylglutathione lyase family enzyme
MTQTIPALPVRDMPSAVAFYRDKLGFQVHDHDGGFAVLGRDEAVVHLWESSDESWREREDAAAKPVCSGAESFIAGTASEFATLDQDGNLVTFFQWVQA